MSDNGPVFFGGLVKHRPADVGDDGRHVGEDGSPHYHHAGCDRAHASPAHAAACAAEEVSGRTQPALKTRRASDTGQFVNDPSRGSVKADVTHVDLTGLPETSTVARQFNRGLLTGGHESDSPQNRGRTSPVARP